ncbi:hypothetical protein J6590_036392 [Homalodisca vitripennis]|nr:hypothetical protein J6590_036392 [Homalodisca vitripennis]
MPIKNYSSEENRYDLNMINLPCALLVSASYIQICKRNDPHLEDCILDSVEKLRPKLKTGIPELDVPGLEPLVLPVVDVSRGTGVRARGTNVTVRGASNFKVTNLKADLNNTKFYIGIKIPFLTFDAQYEVNARILVVPVKGKGPIKANATDVEGNAVLKGRKISRDGDTYVDFTELKLDLDISNYNVHLDNLFNGNKELGDAVNLALNDNKREFMEALRPVVERIVSDVLLDIAKKVTKNFTYDELFPLN